MKKQFLLVSRHLSFVFIDFYLQKLIVSFIQRKGETDFILHNYDLLIIADKAELEVAQQYLEQAAQQNLVLLPIVD